MPIQQMMLGSTPGAEKKYIDEIFSPTVWTGNGNNNRDIVNGIDISTEGGMVWIKRRNEDRDHSLFDTIRGAGKMLSINDNTSEDNETNTLTQFNTNGFRLNDDNYVNSNNNTYCSWTFRKCPKFFTMATWSGNATSGRQIAHDLDMVPGAIIVKCYSSNGHAHAMYHRKAHSSQPEKYFYPIDTGTGATLYQHAWNNTAPTSTHFTLGNNADFNGSGKDYVAWIFAHNNSDGEFGGQSGADGDVIKCDSYTGNGSAGNSVNVGFEPQFIMLHKQEGGYESAPIYVYDCIRGLVTDGNDPYVQAAFNSAEVTNTNRIKVTATGFTLETSNAAVNENSTVYVYTAIRRPDGYVGKPPEVGTDVFAMDYGDGLSGIPVFDSGFPVDFSLNKKWQDPSNWEVGSRLIQGKYLLTNSDNAEATFADFAYDSNAGWNSHNGYDSNWVSWMWKRHAGFDVVNWIGNGNAGHVINHNLSQTPQMTWMKRKDGVSSWEVWHHGLNGGSNNINYRIILDSTNAESASGNITAMDDASFTLGGGNSTNGNNDDNIGILFCSVSGISKVGSYTGSGSSNTQTITTGFQPRFVIIKDYTGNSNPWYVMDTTRGWGSGDDKQLMLDSNSAQLTNDWGAPTSTGFTVTGNGINLDSSSNKYIYYAHA